MNKLVNTSANAGEEFVEELSQNIIYEESNKFFNDIKENFGKTGIESIDSAIESSITVFQFGIQQVVYVAVTEYAITKLSLVLSSLILYIKGRGVVGKLKKFSQKLFSSTKNIPIAGSVLSAAGTAIVGNENQNIAIAQMVNDSSNNIASIVSNERGNQIHLLNNKSKRVQKEKQNIYSLRNTSKHTAMQRYIQKTETGQWKKTKKDKKLYCFVTGENYTTFNFSLDFVNRLNEFSVYAKTAKGQIYSSAKATLDLISQSADSMKD